MVSKATREVMTCPSGTWLRLVHYQRCYLTWIEVFSKAHHWLAYSMGVVRKLMGSDTSARAGRSVEPRSGLQRPEGQ